MAQLTSNQQHPDTLTDGGEPNITTLYTLNKPLLMQLIPHMQKVLRVGHLKKGKGGSVSGHEPRARAAQ